MPNNRTQAGVSHRKTYEIIKATRNESLKGVEVDGKKYNFGRLGNMRISDPGVAKAIEQKWGSYTKGATKEVVVAEVEHAHDFERGHKYSHSFPGMPWHKHDALGKVIKDDMPEGAKAWHSSDSDNSSQTSTKSSAS